MLSHEELIALQPTLQRIVGNDQDALQEVNLRLLERADSIRDPGRYAARTAKTCRLDAAKRRQRHPASLPTDSVIVDPSPTPAETAAAAEERETLQTAIARLPAGQRVAVENPCRANNSSRYKAVSSLRRALSADRCVRG